MFVLLALAMSLQASPCDGTRPSAPPADQVAAMRTAADVVSLSRLVGGAAAPRDITLPVLTNGHAITQFLRENYPQGLRADTVRNTRTMFWVCIDSAGRVVNPTVIRTGGLALLDSFALEAIQRARFMPARTKAGIAAVWMPYPVQIAPYVIYRELPLPDRSETPVFVPYTTKPELINRSQVGRALVSNYPVNLRNSGVGGQAIVWVQLDTEGRVVRTQLKQTSGEPQLDKAALKVASIMRFSPARIGDDPVSVWIQLPIAFRSN